MSDYTGEDIFREFNEERLDRYDDLNKQEVKQNGNTN